ncbi:MAG TPA: phospho-N-acetylmuramoyl-pentapeptide-transferase [Chloroflexota bacterium]|nr:phospho-N-acetylmuramoyl-pentapeptide-transferase [Chloroflexota bacterium]
MSSSAVVALIPLSFLVGMLWAPALVRGLRRLKFGKQIRLEGPSSHQAKAGTPTMGGWLFVLTPVVICAILVPDLASIAPPLVAMLAFGTAGALDDYANMKNKEGVGFRVRYKFVWHGVMSLLLAWWLYQTPALRIQRLPGGSAIDLGWIFVPLAALAIFSCAAGVNEVDGLDGLAGGTSAAAFGSYLVLSLAAGLVAPAAFAASVVGSLLAYLWHNVNPARVFMGDTGALALGAGLAVVAFQTRWGLLLPIVGILFAAELVQVILQVGYFKLTHGRRLFRMAPLHHHFELSGFPETQIVFRFWVAGFVAAALGVALGL